jgi:hypothetical protein
MPESIEYAFDRENTIADNDIFDEFGIGGAGGSRGLPKGRYQESSQELTPSAHGNELLTTKTQKTEKNSHKKAQKTQRSFVFFVPLCGYFSLLHQQDLAGVYR